MQSRVGFRPTRPQLEAGMRIEPAPSEAVAAAQSPAATAAALPPLEPPGLRSVFHGLRVIPNAGPSVSPMITSSGQLVLPMITAPAPRSRRTSSLSCAAGVKFAAVPQPVTSPVTSSTSLTAIGTPSSGRSSPRAAAPVGLLGVHERALVHDLAKRVQLRVEPLDPLEVEDHELARGDLAAADQLRLAGDSCEGEVIAVHAAAQSTRADAATRRVCGRRHAHGAPVPAAAARGSGRRPRSSRSSRSNRLIRPRRTATTLCTVCASFPLPLGLARRGRGASRDAARVAASARVDCAPAWTAASWLSQEPPARRS